MHNFADLVNVLHAFFWDVFHCDAAVFFAVLKADHAPLTAVRRADVSVVAHAVLSADARAVYAAEMAELNVANAELMLDSRVPTAAATHVKLGAGLELAFIVSLARTGNATDEAIINVVAATAKEERVIQMKK